MREEETVDDGEEKRKMGRQKRKMREKLCQTRVEETRPNTRHEMRLARV